MHRPGLPPQVGCLSASACRHVSQAATVHPTVRIASFDDWKVVEEKALAQKMLDLILAMHHCSQCRVL